VLRLVQADGGWFVRGVAFTPLAVPLYAAALVLLLARRLLGVRRGTLLLLLPVAGLVVHGVWLAPLFTGSTPPPAAGAPTVTVMTANLLRGEADAPGLLVEATRRDVDLLAVQEITVEALALLEAAGVDEVFPHRAGETGTAVTGTMLFSRTPVDDVVPVATRLTSLTANVELDGTSWAVAVVHPSAPIDSIGDWRRDHALVLEAAEGIDADLVLGDFNASPDHEPMLALADAGWRDVVELANEGWQPTWPADGVEPVTDLPSPRLVDIDHVLVGERIAALGSQRVRVDGTDHSAVVAQVAAR
jgi:endonuclease/exonuclease/phosphatase family metal-dependent hydrolase